jgi:DNA-binding NarL/FixJ family response regulator
MPAGTIKLGIADRPNLFRKVLMEYLSVKENMRVIFQAADVSELMGKLKHSAPDILLLDIFDAGWNSSELLLLLRKEYPDVRILILSECADPGIVGDLLEYGIYGYISKMDEPEELVEAIMAAANNRIYRNQLLTEALYCSRQSNFAADAAEPGSHLNERERRILQLLWEEKSNREIASQLFLSVRSIEKIRQDMKEKLGIRSTIGLFKYAINHKIISLNNPGEISLVS